MKFTRLSSVAACGDVSFLVAFVVIAVLPHSAFAQADPKLGTWKFNLAKSKFDLGRPLRSVQVGGQFGDSAMELADLDRRLEEAAVKGDAELLERRLGDDLSFTHDGGIKETKSEWVLRARRIPSRYFFAREVSNQVVEIHGDVALVAGRLDIRGFGPKGDPTKTPPNCSAIEYVHLYARRNNQWTLVSNRTTHMIEPFHPCDPFVGTWTLNLAKSTFDPGPPPRSRTVTIEQLGDGVKWAIEQVDANGNRRTVVEMPKFDGKDYPRIGSPTPDADTLALRRIDAHTVEETLKKAGKVVTTYRQVVAKDGRVRTAMTVTGTNASGQPVHDVMVFDKQ